MEIIRCIVLEDEEPAQNLMKFYIKKLADVELVEVFDNALEAADFLENNDIDLIFTDIEMPRLTGLDFIRMQNPCPPIIIITAYPDRANQAYDLDVIDYIVKPLSFERFQKAIKKVQRFLQSQRGENQVSEGVNAIYVKEAGVSIKLILNEINYVEGLGDYVKVFTTGRTITLHMTMSKILENLASAKFIRVHKSFIINTDKISTIDSANSLVMLNDKTQITLGRAYKQDFMARFKAVN
jgi:DNA-binding LytR/AlgR family response regulator